MPLDHQYPLADLGKHSGGSHPAHTGADHDVVPRTIRDVVAPRLVGSAGRVPRLGNGANIHALPAHLARTASSPPTELVVMMVSRISTPASSAGDLERSVLGQKRPFALVAFRFSNRLPASSKCRLA